MQEVPAIGIDRTQLDKQRLRYRPVLGLQRGIKLGDQGVFALGLLVALNGSFLLLFLLSGLFSFFLRLLVSCRHTFGVHSKIRRVGIGNINEEKIVFTAFIDDGHAAPSVNARAFRTKNLYGVVIASREANLGELTLFVGLGDELTATVLVRNDHFCADDWLAAIRYPAANSGQSGLGPDRNRAERKQQPNQRCKK